MEESHCQAIIKVSQYSPICEMKKRWLSDGDKLRGLIGFIMMMMMKIWNIFLFLKSFKNKSYNRSEMQYIACTK